jgi:hypothetical protein
VLLTYITQGLGTIFAIIHPKVKQKPLSFSNVRAQTEKTHGNSSESIDGQGLLTNKGEARTGTAPSLKKWKPPCFSRRNLV